MKKGTCKHFNGSFHNACCAEGVCYREVTTEPDRREGSMLRIPCHNDPAGLSVRQLEEWQKRGTCPKFQEPTAEEISAFEADMAGFMNRMQVVNKALDPIRREHKGKNWQGTIECPVCKGMMHLIHAGSNGHMRVHCETEDCVRWIE